MKCKLFVKPGLIELERSGELDVQMCLELSDDEELVILKP